ncbi:MAG: bifunctional metallophosphatase/5'-nucleotidase [Bacteroidaceae bacterium]|nr:bifunctional metallophosphatase/5'-nucleotidase [Bacteroidaceae bacterium]
MKHLFGFILALAFSASAFAQDADLKIIGINDLHAAVQNFPKFAYLVDSIRKANPDKEVLVMSAGDNRTGNPVNDSYSEPNLPMIEMMNAVGFNVSSMGNHECDHSVESFVNTINKSQCTYVVANMHPADSVKMHVQPFKLFEHQGVRIGVIGIVQINNMGIPDCHPSKVEGIRFSDPLKALDKYKWLRDQCDVYISLNHMGLENDTLIADNHPEIDLMICGHSHDLVPGMMRNGVMICQAKRDVKYFNEIDIKVRGGKVVEKKNKLIDIRATKNFDAKVQAMLDKFSDNPLLNRVVAQATKPFTKKEELGCMMADANRIIAGADISVSNAGGVRYEEKEAGNIIVNDIYRLDPFGNELYTIEITGNELKALLEELPITDEYGPCYVSGFQYTIVADGKNGEYKVKKMLTADGKKFNMNKTYKLALNSYVYSTNKAVSSKPFFNTYKTTADALIEYLEKEKTVDYTGAHRVTIVGGTHR